VTSEAALPERQTACCGEKEVFTRQLSEYLGRAGRAGVWTRGINLPRREGLRGLARVKSLAHASRALCVILAYSKVTFQSRHSTDVQAPLDRM